MIRIFALLLFFLATPVSAVVLGWKPDLSTPISLSLSELKERGQEDWNRIVVDGTELVEGDTLVRTNVALEISPAARFRYSPGARLRFSLESCRLLDPAWFGCLGDGVSDDTLGLRRALDAADAGATIDLLGRTYGVLSGSNSKDIPVVLTVESRDGLCIRDGSILSLSAGPSLVKTTFPSVLAFDRCTNIRLISLSLSAKGESWGDSDASRGLDADGRAEYLATKGGHACVVTRTNGFAATDCSFLGAGSVAAFYASSSTNLDLTRCFASARSLGYFGFGFDGWCGSAANNGMKSFSATLTNCSSSAWNSKYGSKGGVGAEDRDVEVNVIGGQWSDSYANGANPDLGAAFTVSSARLFVRDATVSNCAGVVQLGQSSLATTVFEGTNIDARNLRTFGVLQRRTSFGRSEAILRECSLTFGQEKSLWPSAGIEHTYLLFDSKVGGGLSVVFEDCSIASPELVSNRQEGVRLTLTRCQVVLLK